jgi:hypothetical protein
MEERKKKEEDRVRKEQEEKKQRDQEEKLRRLEEVEKRRQLIMMAQKVNFQKIMLTIFYNLWYQLWHRFQLLFADLVTILPIPYHSRPECQEKGKSSHYS